MAIRFHCTNLVRFDPETKQYIKCGHEITVDAALAADTIRCPECGNDVEVPIGLQQDAPAGLSPSELGLASNEAESHGSRSSNSGSATTTKRPESQRSNQPTSPHSSSPPVTNVRPAADRFASPSKGSIDDAELETESRVLQYASFNPQTTCLKCGALVASDMTQCPTCGAARRVLKDDRPLESYEVKPAGMQLWWRGTMTSAPSRGPFLKLANFVIVWVVSCLVAISIFVLGIFNFIVSAPLLLVTAGYFLSLRRLKKMSQNPGLPLTRWQRIVWNGCLPFFRAINWRFSAFPNPTVWTAHGSNFTGIDMHEHPGVQSHNILDLSGSRLGDDELRTLRHSKHIAALVVTGTQVTDEGIFRLQQEIPRAWIWY